MSLQDAHTSSGTTPARISSPKTWQPTQNPTNASSDGRDEEDPEHDLGEVEPIGSVGEERGGDGERRADGLREPLRAGPPRVGARSAAPA